MTGHVVFWVESVGDPVRLGEYKRAAHPTIVAAGGSVRIAYGQTELIEGPPMLGIVVVDFPTYADAVSWYHSEAYQRAKALRRDAVTVRAAIVEGRSP